MSLDHQDDLDEFEYADEDETVRSYMLTRGRTRAEVEELAIETLVSATDFALQGQNGLQREHRQILELLSGSLSVAEIAAHLGIPLRAAIVLTSEMVDAGTLSTGAAIELIDQDFLSKIRSALTLL